MPGRVVIIGGGLAGLAAAAALAGRDLDVTLLESRTRLGGRAGSFTDSASGQLLDVCQHVSMGCCTNLAHFCRTVGIAHFLRPQRDLWFLTPDRRLSRFGADSLPAPLHLARSFLRAHYLTLTEKLRIAWGLACLKYPSLALQACVRHPSLALQACVRRPSLALQACGQHPSLALQACGGQSPADTDPPFADWLERHGQTPRTVARFWGLILTSALNETPDRIGLRYARKVFLDGFLRHRRGCEVELPQVPLGRLYGPELQGWLECHGVHLHLGRAARGLRIAGREVVGLEMRGGDIEEADWYIAAVPFDRLLDLLPGEIAAEPPFAGLRNLETSPITSVHLWYDRPIAPLPHAVLVDCVGQWLFNRGETTPGEHYLQVVVSAARAFRGLGHEEVERRIVAELAGLFPAATAARLVRARVVTEHAATFSAVPGVDRWRPPQASPLRNLLLAGDWTATGWPATMEGAVRSGYLAAEALLRRRGARVRLLQPDL
jgi:squalene-associated FAD-dependent desaturase